LTGAPSPHPKNFVTKKEDKLKFILTKNIIELKNSNTKGYCLVILNSVIMSLTQLV